MNRREFILLLPTFFVAVWKTIRPRRSSSSREGRFYIAGVKYHKQDSDVSSGQRLLLKSQLFKNELAFAILTEEGEQLGFVPRSWIPLVERAKITSARLVETNKYGVPWRRYLVSIPNVQPL